MTIKSAIANLAAAFRADPSITTEHPASVAARKAIGDHGLTISSFRIARSFCDREGIPYTIVTKEGLLSSKLGYQAGSTRRA